MRIACIALLSCAGAAGLFGQTAAAQTFEVASIKLAAFPSEAYFAGRTAAGPCGKSNAKVSGNRVTVQMISLCGLIRVAYGVQAYQISGIPKDLLKAVPTNYYDIQAKADGDLTRDRAVPMLRSLLETRFQLKFHREPRELPVYNLEVGKNGPKLSTDGKGVCEGPTGAWTTSGAKGFGFKFCKPNTSAEQLADILTPETDRPVLDKTGLTGQYAFELHFSPEGAPAGPDSQPGLFTAIQEQLGLKLIPAKGLVETLVIDRAERPTEN